ncbi:MAG: DNA recombination protein RmuC [Bacteroidales bacterium]|nr:DNA recombination protein RmuC [Bacteroidales bacterium]
MNVLVLVAGIVAGGLTGGILVWFFLSKHLQEKNRELKEKEAEIRDMGAALASSKTALVHKEEELTGMKEKLTVQFENLANKILEVNTQKFEEKSRKSMQQMLDPLREQMKEFRKKVEDTHVEDTKQRVALDERIRGLIEQTNLVSAEASNLAQALKGQSKTRGDWGEMLLERILEHSGLEFGTHYQLQEHHKNPDGKTIIPDALVRLPGERVVIIDSKVSLLAYDRYVAATDEQEQEKALAEHLISLKSHVADLASKEYTSIEHTLDFVIMFVPIEPAYILAIQKEQALWNDAYSKGIVLISPTNLIACLKLISDLWTRELQSKNAQEIADRGEKMLKKFEGFVRTLEAVGTSIKRSQEAYDTAMNQLKTGRGNLIRQATMLKELGVKASGKTAALLPSDWEEDEDEVEE